MKEYDCSCWMHYPNPYKECKNGHWICKDRYRLVEDTHECTNTLGGHYRVATHCRRIKDATKIRL